MTLLSIGLVCVLEQLAQQAGDLVMLDDACILPAYNTRFIYEHTVGQYAFPVSVSQAGIENIGFTDQYRVSDAIGFYKALDGFGIVKGDSHHL